MVRSPGQLPNRLNTDHTHLKSEIIDDETREPAEFPEAGGGLTVDNQSDPPAEVTTLIAPGALLSNDEATLSTSHPFGEAATGAENANAAHVITAEEGEADASTNATAVDEFADASSHAFTTGDGDAYANSEAQAGGSGEAFTSPTARNTGSGPAEVTATATTVTGRARSGVKAVRGVDEVSLTVVVTAAGLKEMILVGVPTADPAVAGRVWNDGGTLKISAG